MNSGRILSIQSHVVSGNVGNKSAVFPLQLLGFEVDPLNSVQFSNHTGYSKGVKGQVLNAGELWDLVSGLKDNRLISNYETVITGYIGNKSFLENIAEVIMLLKSENPTMEYVCDPVMGDTKPGLYVPKELIGLYKEIILPLADICMPNQFELELLTGIKIKEEKDCLRALDALIKVGVKKAILTSMDLEGPDQSIHTYACSSDEDRVYKFSVPKIPASFVGSGDLFTALSVAWLKKDNNLGEALKKVIATMQFILRKTYEAAGPENLKNPAKMELKIIQSKRAIENPETSSVQMSLISKE